MFNGYFMWVGMSHDRFVDGRNVKASHTWNGGQKAFVETTKSLMFATTQEGP
jgi:hypothetical protein